MKYWLTLTCAITMVSMAYADTMNDSENLVAATTPSKGSALPQSQKGKIATKVSETPSSPSVSNEKGGCDFFFTADYLYWTAREQGLEFATTGIALTSLGNHAPAQSGHVFSPDWEWNSGFKVGIGVTFNERNWDLYLNYTWLHTDASESFTLKDYQPNVLFPYSADNAVFYLFNGIQGEYTNARGRWDLHFNVLDLELGRTFVVTDYLTLRPHFGLKSSWQDDDFHHTYGNLAGSISGKRDQDYWGIGLRAGVKSKWFFVKHWGVFGDLALSALWSHYKLHNTDTFDNGTSIPLMNMNETVHSIQPVIELVLGFLYETTYNDDKYRFNIHAGWEMQSWINQNQRIALAQVGSKGDLSLQGLTAGLRFDF
jgi:hypothetical protein